MGQIVSYLGYWNWNYLFILLAVFGLLGGIWSLIRGIYHTSLRYVIHGLLLVVLIFCMGEIVNAVASIDLSQWFNYTISLNGVGVKLTTVDQTVIDALNAYGLVNSASDPSLYLIALQVSHAIIGFAFFIVGFILIWIITPIIEELVYAITFLVFLSKERRKNKKHRWISFGVGFVCSAVIGALFLSPLTSLANVLSGVATEVNNNKSDSTDYGDYQAFIDLLAAYNNSAYYSAMTLGSKDSSKAMDTSVMSTVTSMTISGTTTSLAGEINSILSTVSGLTDCITVENNKISFDVGKLADATVVSSLLDGASQWKLVMSLIPAMAEIGLKSANLDLSNYGMDFSAVDWSGTLTDINTIYEKLYLTGLIDEYAIPTMTGQGSATFKLTYDKKDSFKAAVDAVCDSDLFKSWLPSILSYQAKAYCKSSGTSYLSCIESDYENIDFKALFDYLIEISFDLFRVIGMNEISMSELTNGLTEKITSALSDSGKFDNIVSLLCGGTVNLAAVDDGTVTLEAEEITIDKGLFDLDVFSDKVVNLGGLVSSTLGSMTSTYISQDSLDTIAKELNTTTSLSTEIRSILSIVPQAKKLVDGGFDITNEETRTEMKSLLKKVGNSTIINTILPDLIYSALNNDSVKSMLFGLSADSFDLHPTDSEGKSILVDQISDLLDIVSEATTFSTAFSSGDPFDSLTEDMCDTLNGMLTSIYNNKVLNPDNVFDPTTGTTVHNHNFTTLIKYIFSQDSLTNMGFTLPSNIDTIAWSTTQVNDASGVANTTVGEIKNLTDALKIIRTNASAFSTSGTDISSLNATSIKSLFTTVGKSELIGPSLASILDSTVAPSINNAGLGVTVSFKTVTDWEKEGEAFSNVLSRLKDLSGVNIADIDWMKLDSKEVNAILTALAETQMLGAQYDASGNYTGHNATLADDGTYVDQFGQIAYSFISKANMTDMIGTSITEDDFSSLSTKYADTSGNPQFKTGFYWATDIKAFDYSFTYNSSTVNVTAGLLDCSGEIAGLTTGKLNTSTGAVIDDIGILEAANKLEDLKSGDSYDFTGKSASDIEPILYAISNSKLFYKSIGSIINYLTKDMNMDLGGGNSVDFALVNGTYIDSLSDTNRKTELTNLCELLEIVNSSSFKTAISSGITGLGDTEGGKAATVQLISSLNYMSKLGCMTSVKAHNSYSFFDEMIATMMAQSTLDTMIMDVTDTTIAKKEMLAYVASIDDWSYTLASSDTLTTDLLDNLYSTSYADSSEILRLGHVIRVIAVNGISTENLSDPSKIDATKMSDLLTAINNSELMHPAVSSIFGNVFDAVNFNSYLLLDGTGGDTGVDAEYFTTINTDVYLDFSSEAKTFWQNEIDQLVTLYTSLGAQKDITEIRIGAGGDAITTYELLGPINNMNLLKEVKAYLVYGFFTNAAEGSNNDQDINPYIRSYESLVYPSAITSVGTSENIANNKSKYDKSMRIASVFFMDGQTDAQFKNQCDIIDSLIKNLTALSTSLAGSLSGGGADLGLSMFNAIMSTFLVNDDGSYQRGGLAQELVSGLLASKLNSVNLGILTDLNSKSFTSTADSSKNISVTSSSTDKSTGNLTFEGSTGWTYVQEGTTTDNLVVLTITKDSTVKYIDVDTSANTYTEQSSKTETIDDFFANIFYGDSSNRLDYVYLNIIEARGLQGVLQLKDVGSYGTTTDDHDIFSANLKAAFTLMGRSVTTDPYASTVTNYVAYNALVSNTEAMAGSSLYLSKYGSTQHNSLVAKTLFMTYASTIKPFDASPTTTLMDTINGWNLYVQAQIDFGNPSFSDADKINFETKSFADNADNVIKAVEYYA